MKKNLLTVGTIVALCGCMVSTSCIGSFQLTKKLLAWNNTIGNKFLNELVFVAFWVLPVYEVSGLADFLVLNSIEFWSGTNPVAQGTFKIDGRHGERYLVRCDRKGYTVTNEAEGYSFRFDFNEDSREWSIDINDERYVFMTFVDDSHVRMPLPHGESVVVSTDAGGLYAYQTRVASSDMAAR